MLAPEFVPDAAMKLVLQLFKNIRWQRVPRERPKSLCAIELKSRVAEVLAKFCVGIQILDAQYRSLDVVLIGVEKRTKT